MIKRVTIQFVVKITDELLAGGLLSDENVIEQLKEAYNDFIRTEECSDATIKIDTMELDEIEAMPSENIAPIVHAYWTDGSFSSNPVKVDKNGNPQGSCCCSNCGKWLVASDEYYVMGRYCPNCGARMDKGVEE